MPLIYIQSSLLIFIQTSKGADIISIRGYSVLSRPARVCRAEILTIAA
jgi:hypothetical protein